MTISISVERIEFPSDDTSVLTDAALSELAIKDRHGVTSLLGLQGVEIAESEVTVRGDGTIVINNAAFRKQLEQYLKLQNIQTEDTNIGTCVPIGNAMCPCPNIMCPCKIF